MSITVLWIPLSLMMTMLAILDAKSVFDDFEDQLITPNITVWKNEPNEEEREHCYKQKEMSAPIMCWSFVKTQSSITFNCTTKGYNAADIKIYIGKSLQNSTIDNGQEAGDKVAPLEISQLQVRHINEVFSCQVVHNSKNYSLAAMKLQNKNNVSPESPVFLGATRNSEEFDVTNGYVLKCHIDDARFDSVLEIGSDEKLNTARSENNGFKPLEVEYTLNSSSQFSKVYCQHNYSTLKKNAIKNIRLKWALHKKENEENTRNRSAEKTSDKKGNEDDTQKSSTDISRGDSEQTQYLVIVGAIVAGIAVTLVTCLTWMFFRRRHLRKCGERRPLRSNSEDVLRGTARGDADDEYASVLHRSQRRPSCARDDLYAAVVPKSKRLQNAEGNYSEPYDHVPDQPYLDIGSDIYESMSGSEHYAEPSRGPRYANEPCGDADSGLYAVPSSVSDEYANADALRINEKSAPNPIEPPYSTVRPRVAPKPQPHQKNTGASGYVVMK